MDSAPPGVRESRASVGSGEKRGKDGSTFGCPGGPKSQEVSGAAEARPAGPGGRERGAAGLSDQALALPAGAVAQAAAETDAAGSRDAEREIVEACRRGDREAFDGLVLRYQRDVYRLCFRYVNNHEDANDLAQEVFLKAWRAIGRFRGDSSVSTWLYRIAVNACLNFRSSRRPLSVELPEEIPDPARGAAADVEAEDAARRVRAAVSRLPDRQRATLILKVFHDLKHEEVAAALGSTVGTVKANLFHALGNLRKLMAAEEEKGR
jgi:RNA polymerase sigma-70 factor (ECF subfamily)